MSTPAVFLDRDGVLNEVVIRNGKPASPRTFDEFVWIEGVAAQVETLKKAGYLVFVVTNQPDVARRKMTIDALQRMHDAIAERLPVDEIVACTHDDGDPRCDCRKPKPGMLLKIAKKFPVDLSRSYMIGDSARDVGAGKAAGVRTILIQRDYNRDDSAEYYAADLAVAVHLILNESS